MTSYHGKNTWMCGDCVALLGESYDDLKCIYNLSTNAFGHCLGHQEKKKKKRGEK
jgi:hypothetical protein